MLTFPFSKVRGEKKKKVKKGKIRIILTFISHLPFNHGKTGLARTSDLLRNRKKAIQN